MNTYWTQNLDKLEEYCNRVISNQQKEKEQYLKKESEILIRDKNRNYKIVSKNYYLYHLEDDEMDTEEELVDEDDWIEEKRLIAKYSPKPQAPP